MVKYDTDVGLIYLWLFFSFVMSFHAFTVSIPATPPSYEPSTTPREQLSDLSGMREFSNRKGL